MAAPGIPTNPSPADRLPGVTMRNTPLAWTAPGAVACRVYLGPQVHRVQSQIAAEDLHLSGVGHRVEGDLFTLDPNQDGSADLLTSADETPSGTLVLTPFRSYYWRVIAVNADGETSGPLWKFSTGAYEAPPLDAPAEPSGPSPADNGLASLTPTLTWAPSARATFYLVSFDTTDPPALVALELGPSYAPGTLLNHTEYFWSVTATNAAGETAGPVWSFKTAVPATVSLALATGDGLGIGAYEYAYALVVDGVESAVGPRTAITTGAVPVLTPPLDLSRTFVYSPGSGDPFAVGTSAADGEWKWAMTFVNANGETVPGPTITNPAAGPGPYYAALANVRIGPAGVTARKIYRTVRFGSQLKLLTTIADNTTTTYDDHTADGSLGANAPSVNTATLTPDHQVIVSGIAVGPDGTTARKLYRTAVNGSQLKLVTTIADNTTTTYLDFTTDGSLGAAPP